ncbi:MAG: hypothetical protein WCK58_07970 [Chloroflexota bacterium]
MIIEPVPTNPTAPWRRALRVAGIVAPAALLLAVVAAGVLGPRPELPPTAPLPSVADAAIAAPSVTVPASPAPSTPGDPAPLEGPPPPAGFAGLRTLSVPHLLDHRLAGQALGLVAVGGWLAMPSGTDACDGISLDPTGPWCLRTGILADGPWSGVRGISAPIPAHVHVTIPVGVRVPPSVAGTADVAGGAPVAVLVLGRFTDDGVACAGGSRGSCEDGFVVERIAWAAGARTGLTPLVADRLASERRANPFAIAPAAEVPLAAVLDWPDRIATLDPAAAAAAARGAASQPVWYLRTYDAALHAIRWRLLAERDLAVVASGSEARFTGIASAADDVATTVTLGGVAFPSTFGGLASAAPSVTVASRAAGMLPGPAVVMGFLKVAAPDGVCAGAGLGPLGAWCTRHGVLAEHAWAVTGADFDPLAAHLHVTLPVGVALPPALVHMATATAGAPLPVLAVGHFTGTPCSPADLAWCEEPFTVDRIAWVDGDPTTIAPIVQAGLRLGQGTPRAAHRSTAESLATGWSGTLLVSALVHTRVLAGLDPAAAALAARRAAGHPVWYVRALETVYGSMRFPPGDVPPRVSWVVLDDTTGVVIAWGVT